MKTKFGNPCVAMCKKQIAATVFGFMFLIALGVIAVLILWQNTNLLCQPDAEDQWLTPLKFW